MSIAQLCIDKKVITLGIAVAMLLAGTLAYTKLGRLEDPEFTIKTAQVVTIYPGATAEEVADEVTDKIEIAIQQLGQLDKVTSKSYSGRSIVKLDIKNTFSKKELPQIWDELRRKVGDMQHTLPPGCQPSVVYDDFGDLFGVFYAIYGDGYSYAELKEHAKLLRKELLLCQDVAKIEVIGDQQETVYLEVSRARMAGMGISPDMIQSVIQRQNTAQSAGNIEIGDKFIRIHPTGQLKTIGDIGDLMISRVHDNNKTTIRIRDIATLKRGYVWPAKNYIRYNGKPSIGLAISTVSGGNVITMGNAIDARMKELLLETPIGIEVGIISHQAQSVGVAISGFIVNLVEAVVIVIAVLLFAMGMRSGLIIGGILVLTVLSTVMVMQWMGIMFERISLGAFIIALGMLVDNAIVVTEEVLIAAQKGTSRSKAAVAVVEQTKWPLLGATVIAILSFAPIGASQDSTGEYCRSLFLVLMISLFMSWVLAITVTPLVASALLKKSKPVEGEAQKDPYDTAFFRAYRSFLRSCMNHRFISLIVMGVLLFAAIHGFKSVSQNFFPDSTRPQFMVHLWMPQGSAIDSTDRLITKLDDYTRKVDGVSSSTAMTGTGGKRFLLTYGPEDPDAAYGIIFVDVDDYKKIPEIARQIVSFAENEIPDALVYSQRFVLGPGDAQKIQMRILGSDPEVLRQLASKAIAVLHSDPKLVEVQSDWRNKVDLLQPIISEAKARNLGITRAEVARAMQRAYLGNTIGYLKEGDESLPIILRPPDKERANPDALYGLWLWSKALNSAVPVAQVVDRFVNTSEEARLGRQNRTACITVKCNTTGETAATAFARLMPQLLETIEAYPDGYWHEWGGEYESSTDAQSALVGKIPGIIAVMILITIILFNSIKKPLVIFMTVPLIVIGVTIGLLLCNQPFGFMALLGFLSLAGMQIKNAIVLVDEIQVQEKLGVDPFNAIINAGTTRLRPVSMAALTTVLGMLPLITDAFYVSMAVTIMFGLTFATILTMLIVPVNYALVFNLKDPAKNGG
ncbi:MAG: efflux RND transporter permease subunit [Kiritimatiellae bacterium]|nr:efflux RND transporter permease subunit [Kiritimatiellia bacterium]